MKPNHEAPASAQVIAPYHREMLAQRSQPAHETGATSDMSSEIGKADFNAILVVLKRRRAPDDGARTIL